MHRTRVTTLVLSAVALSAVLAGCGRLQAVDGTASPAVQPGAEAIQPAAAAVTAAIRTAQADELGPIVTDGEGKTFYRFDKDTAKPPTTTCVGECATAWPPVLVDDPAGLDVAGFDRALLGTVERADGARQLTIAGWPAYRYAKDAAAGEVKGQGAGGKWFAFTAEGKKAGSPGGPAVALAVMKVGTLGPIVTDREGMTLYRFDRDTAKPPASNCAGDCAVKWPPVLVPAGTEVAVDGLDRAAVGTVARPDGNRQVTIGGWPVYRFAGDKVPCDTFGQGAGGTWFAVTATGGKAGG
ncbi:hypothetical protein [Actinokineospora sp.]|uniref:hypothetical protein n=1 Tax=Actinokineospora sp. TaxID=1872133 RepID=UPI004037F9C2